MKRMYVAAIAAVFALGPVAGGAVTYNIANDFGSTNPSGVWSYGYFGPSFSGGATFPNYYNNGSIEGWDDPSLSQTSVYGTPTDAHNISGGELTIGTVVLLANQATSHPGQNNEIVGYAFQAPTAGAYQINATFSGRDFVGPTDTEVEILTNPAGPIFTGIVNGYAGDSTRAAFGASPSVSYSGTTSLGEGEFLYFLVQFDPNGSRSTGPFYYDTTGFDVTVSDAAVPEPGAMALLGGGLLGLAAIARCRR